MDLTRKCVDPPAPGVNIRGRGGGKVTPRDAYWVVIRESMTGLRSSKLIMSLMSFFDDKRFLDSFTFRKRDQAWEKSSIGETNRSLLRRGRGLPPEESS